MEKGGAGRSITIIKDFLEEIQIMVENRQDECMAWSTMRLGQFEEAASISKIPLRDASSRKPEI